MRRVFVKSFTESRTLLLTFVNTQSPADAPDFALAKLELMEHQWNSLSSFLIVLNDYSPKTPLPIRLSGRIVV
jgi:hypothetical protein